MILRLPILLYAAMALSCGSRWVGSPVPESPATLRAYAQIHGFHIGTAVSSGLLEDEPEYGRTVAREFNMLTPENEMKFSRLRPKPSGYDFTGADRIVDSAQVLQMNVRGHTLVWYNSLPAWLTQGNWTRQELIQILRDHITTVVERYRGRVAAWDVVNEAIADDGSLRASFWLRGIGPEYIRMAFEWAHEADPSALLFYNDYGAEGAGPKADAIYRLVKHLLDEGVPIHGVGLQMHVGLDKFPEPGQVSDNMARLSALGLEIHITEMDVRIKGVPTHSKLIGQARIYRNMLNACLAEQKCTAMVLWGFTDAHSWVPHFYDGWDNALIFDRRYHPKPAYHALIDVLASHGGSTD